MTGQGTETGRNALAGLPAVQSRRLRRNRLYRRGERTFSSLGRRTSATLQDSSSWNYTYNQRSEITSAIRKNASNVAQNTMRYQYDTIGNRTSSYEDASSKTYDANCLNQYTEIDVTGGSSVCPLYDDDGNMTQFDSSTYTYDAENRLVGAQNGTTRLEFIYDALGRRVARKLYLNNTLSKHHRYVYDGMKLLATYNAKSSFAKINSFLWQPFGLDVPLIMTYNSTVYGYLVDANKNVLGLFNPSKTRVATYLYGPFGQKLSESGTIAANNPLQFSSEQFDTDLSLVYYNFRYYFPAIGKWLTKDPIGERGGLNLYAFCENNAVNTWDEWGLWGSFGPWNDHSPMTEEALMRINPNLDSRIVDNIVKGNLFTDRNNDYSRNMHRHFNREMEENPVNAIIGYWFLLQWERIKVLLLLSQIPNSASFTCETKEICEEALKHMGILSHMGQDFYGHAVSFQTTVEDNTPGNIPSYTSPNIPIGVKPSNYGGLLKQSEHGALFRYFNPNNAEPGNRATDRKQRIDRSIEWTVMTLKPLLKIWEKKCKKYLEFTKEENFWERSVLYIKKLFN